MIILLLLTFLSSDSTEMLTLRPPTQITITCKDNKKAVIDFSGDMVTYSGDCYVSESADVFFKALLPDYKCTKDKP